MRSPAQVVVAVPVGAEEACEQLEEIADAVVCPLRPAPFHAVGLWYVHFEPVDEGYALASLRKANRSLRTPHDGFLS